MSKRLLFTLLLAGGCTADVLVPGGSFEDASFAGEPSGGGQSGSGLVPGTLTAGAWDDNLNFDFFLGYLERVEGEGLPGLPSVRRDDRVVVTVVDEAGQPVAGAVVEASANGQVARTITGADGLALVFPAWEGLPGELEVTARLGDVETQAVVEDGAARLVLATQATLVDALDVALVLDTTGSMGDELEYLKVELGAIASRIERLYPGVKQRWALVLYRDQGDEYVVRSYEFTDAGSFSTLLAGQSAAGGGDYPEALDQGLLAATRLGWKSGATARLAFLVADAPHHAAHAGRLLQAVAAARKLGVHIYPVASSGVDEVTEYSLRTAAQATGGRYLFLTDDSGVGGPHKEPTLPCYFVTKLDAAMLRMIEVELTGVYREPASREVLRTGGDPADRHCQLSDGRVVTAY